MEPLTLGYKGPGSHPDLFPGTPQTLLHAHTAVCAVLWDKGLYSVNDSLNKALIGQ